MSNFVTVWTFTHPSEAYVVMGRLESEGIECYLVNELTTQVNPLYSNAVGGVKLQVKDEHLPLAIESLKASGYAYEEERSTSPIYDWIAVKLDKRFRFQKLPKLGILFSVVLAIAAIVFIAYILIKPSLYDVLTEPTWCVHRVVYNHESYAPNTNQGLILTMQGMCNETVTFDSDGRLKLPGFSTRAIYGTWRLGTRSVEIQTDTLQDVFNGKYLIEYSTNELTLTSPKTTIKCFRN